MIADRVDEVFNLVGRAGPGRAVRWRPGAAVLALALAVAPGCDGEVAIDCTTREPGSCHGACAYTVEGCRDTCSMDDDCDDHEACRETSGKKVPGPVQTDDNPGSVPVCLPR